MKSAKGFLSRVMAETAGAALAFLVVFLSLPTCSVDVDAARQEWSVLVPPTSVVEIYSIQPVYGAVFLTSYDSDAIYRVWRYTDDTKWQVAFDSRGSFAAGIPTSKSDPALRRSGIEASPDGAAIYLFNHNRSEIWRSVDSGNTWLRLATPPPQASGFSPGAMLVIDSAKLVIAAANANIVAVTIDAGTTWMNSNFAVGTVRDIELAPNGELIAAGIDAKSGTARVAISSNLARNWEVIPASVPFGYADEVYATVPPDFTTSRRILITGADKDEDSGVWEWVLGASTAWQRLDGIKGTAIVNLGYGLVAGPGEGVAGNPDEGSGIVYAADYLDGAISRIRGSATQAESIVGIPGGHFIGLWYLSRTGELFALGSDHSIYRYTDMLNRGGSSLQVSQPTPEGTVVLFWQPLAYATGYKIVINSESVYKTAQLSYYKAGSDEGIAIEYKEGDTQATVSGIKQNTYYYVTVWASAPVSSFAYPVAEFTTPLVPPISPSIITDPATGMNDGQATLNGVIDSLGSAQALLVYFEYGTTTQYGNRTKPQNMTTPGPLSAVITGLSAGAVYHFRAVAERLDGGASITGFDVAFRLPPATIQPTNTTQPTPTPTLAISVSTNPATGLDAGGSATLNGTLVSLGGRETVNVYFEYGLNTAYGSKTVPQTMSAPGGFSAAIDGLQPGTACYFRAVADGGEAGIGTGAGISFSVPAAGGAGPSPWIWLTAAMAVAVGGLAAARYVRNSKLKKQKTEPARRFDMRSRPDPGKQKVKWAGQEQIRFEMNLKAVKDTGKQSILKKKTLVTGERKG